MSRVMVVSILTALFTGSVFAADVHVPFIKKAVPAQGLTASYSTSQGRKEVVCVLEDFYKGWLYVTLDGKEKDTYYNYGNGADGLQVSLTSTGPTNDADGRVHVDSVGTFTVKNGPRDSHPTASCFYAPDADL